MHSNWETYISSKQGIVAARNSFQEDCVTLYKKLSSQTAEPIDSKKGDGGVDIFIGKIGTADIDVYQCKFFHDGFGETQKNQIRKSFKTVKESTQFTTRSWTLCVPCDLNISEWKWWNQWKSKNETEKIKIEVKTGTSLIELFKDTGLFSQVFQPSNRDLSESSNKNFSEVNDKLAKMQESIARLEKKEPPPVSTNKQNHTIHNTLEKTFQYLNDNTQVLSELDQIRLFLFSSSLLYSEKISTNLLENHEINLLYQYKENIDLNNVEIRLIFRTLISDTYGTKPGWFWLRNFKEIHVVLRYFLINDPSKDVQIGSFNLLKAYKKEFVLKTISLLIRSKTDNEELWEKVIAYLMTIPSEKTISFLEKITTLAPSLEEKINSSIQKIQVLVNPLKLKDVTVDKDTKASLLAILTENATTDKLLQYTADPDESLKEKATVKLIVKKYYSLNELSEFANSTSKKVRYFAIQELIEKRAINSVSEISSKLKEENETISKYFDPYNKETLVRLLYRKMSKLQLQSEFSWTNIEGTLAFEVYYTRFYSSGKTQLLKHISEDFENLKKDLLVKEADQFKTTVAQLLKSFNQYDDFIKSRFILATLKVLNAVNEKSTTISLQKYLSQRDSSIREEVVKHVINRQNPLDIPLLTRIVKDNLVYNNSATLAALELDKDNIYQTKETFLASKNTKVVLNTVSYCAQKKIQISKKILFALLYDPLADIRLATVAYLASTKGNNFLKKILEDYYTKSDTYYYNVTGNLDKILYSTPKLKKYYKNKLMAYLNSVLKGKTESLELE